MLWVWLLWFGVCCFGLVLCVELIFIFLVGSMVCMRYVMILWGVLLVVCFVFGIVVGLLGMYVFNMYGFVDLYIVVIYMVVVLVFFVLYYMMEMNVEVVVLFDVGYGVVVLCVFVFFGGLFLLL